MTVETSAHTIVTELGKWPLHGSQGNEVRLLTVEYPPGVHTPPHRHPGSQLVYVLDGRIQNHMEGETAREFATGESWFEHQGQLHIDIGNDTNEAAKILVVNVSEAGQPVLVTEL